jgi:single-strand DNA-binding protein
MNHFYGIGRLGKDSELKFTKNGDAVLNFTVAVNTGYGDNPKTTWWNCSIFGKRAEALSEYLKKGTQVAVSGAPSNDPFTTKDGTQRYDLNLRVSDLTLLGSKGDSNTPKENNNASQAQPSVDFEDAIPF